MKVKELAMVINDEQDVVISGDFMLGFVRRKACEIPPTLLNATVLEVSPVHKTDELLIWVEI